MVQDLFKGAQAWLERTNPLAGMSIQALQNVFDAARSGDTQRLHWIFNEIENANPVLMVCIERRAAAIANFKWVITPRANADESLAAEQLDAATRFFDGIENFTDALEHLGLAFFRGFSHVQPIWEGNTVNHIELLDSWRFLRRPGEGWLYNPKCDGFSRTAESCQGARLMSVERKRIADYPALGIHVRRTIGERDWGRFIERYALPKPAVTMAQGAQVADKPDYLAAAAAVENGQVSIWPNGSAIQDFAGGSRGVDPFSTFIEHQEKCLVLLATGGTLMSLAESGAGTLAGNAQKDVWQSIVSRDSGVIVNSVTKALLNPFIETAFKGHPRAVDFDFSSDEKPTPKEVFETAEIAKRAGFAIDKAQIEEETGYTLEIVSDAPANTPLNPLNARFSHSLTAPLLNKAFKTNAKGFKINETNSDAQGGGQAKDALESKIYGGSDDDLASRLFAVMQEEAKKSLEATANELPDESKNG